MLSATATSRDLALAALLALIATAATAPAQKTYKDDRYGFELQIPRDFTEIPINMDEKWVVAKFLYKRPLEEKDGWTEHVPEMRIIIFPKVDVKAVAAAREEEKKRMTRDKAGKVTIINLLDHLQNPFKSYHEYLRENYKKGGWFVTDEQETKVGGLPAIRKEITAEDKMGRGTKLTLIAWEIDYGDATYVLQFESLKDHDHKFRAAVNGSTKRFKKVDRTEPLRSAVTNGEPGAETKKEREALVADKKLTPEERRKAREADLKRAIDKAEKSLTEGWKSYKEGPFSVFYNTDLRFAKRVSKQANLMWDFMHRTFSYIGEDHSVGGILRVCRNQHEGQTYLDTSSRSGDELTAREIVLWDDKDWGFNDSGSGVLNQRILSQYLYDKNARLWWSLPPWMDWGMGLYIDALKMKGNKLVAQPDEWDMEVIRESLRNGKFKPSKELFVTKYDTFQATREDRVQCFAMVDFLMESKDKKLKGVIKDYLLTLDKKIRELYKLQDEAIAKLGSDDKEERSKWDSEWKSRRDKIFEDCYETVFGQWSDRDWDRFDAAWKKAYKR